MKPIVGEEMAKGSVSLWFNAKGHLVGGVENDQFLLAMEGREAISFQDGHLAGTIYDGTGETPFIGTVALQNDKIIYVGKPKNFETNKIIDATGKAVAPGFIRSDMTVNLDEKELKKMIPVNRFGEAEEVADLVSFLVSKKSSYITGEIININGGIYS